jgi:lysophospholipid hydrolase
VNTLQQAKVAKNCLYLAMPVQDYGTMQFGKFDELLKKGYHSAIDFLEKFEDDGRLPSAIIESKDGHISGKKKGRSARRNSI